MSSGWPGGEEGGGGGGGPRGGSGGDEDESFLGTDPIFSLGEDSGPPPYKQRSWVAKHVAWFTPEGWRDRVIRRRLIEAAFQAWRAWRLSKAGSHARTKLRRTEAGREYLRTVDAASGAAPKPPPPRPAPTASNTDKLLWLVGVLAQQYGDAQRAEAQERALRAQARMFRTRAGIPARVTVTPEGDSMPLGLGGFGFGGVPTGLDFPYPTSGGGLLDSLLGAAPGIIQSFLGEQEAAEAPDVLERLGLATGLEGAVEREAVFWVPTRSGVRANPEIYARNPISGRLTVWKNAGRPVLFSGDLATCKRVNKIASRFGRAAARRGPFRSTRRRR